MPSHVCSVRLFSVPISLLRLNSCNTICVAAGLETLRDFNPPSRISSVLGFMTDFDGTRPCSFLSKPSHRSQSATPTVSLSDVGTVHGHNFYNGNSMAYLLHLSNQLAR